MLKPHHLTALRDIVGAEGVIASPDQLLVYECDGMTLDRISPEAVVLPRNTEETSAVVRYLHRERIPIVPRGAGTGLSGGSLAVQGGVMIALTKMNKILEIDIRNGRAVVEAGVLNLDITNAVSAQGLHFAPDPSSQMACTIGGNVAENAGGPHTLKYGVTTNHVLGVELVLPNGDVVNLGGKVEDVPGYDLTGLVNGSEGTFGIITKVIVKLTPLPQGYKTFLAIFDTVDDTTHTISEIIAAGIIPAALEMIDSVVLDALEEAFHMGFPLDAGAILLIELDGLAAGLEQQGERVARICRKNHVRELRVARDADERMRLWMARKKAFGALGRVTSSYYTQDSVVPRTKLPEILRRIYDIGRQYNLRIANVFHAGDGNLHPTILFDERDADQVRRTIQASEEILKACVDLGGSLTGEHGIGFEKMNYLPWLFSEADLTIMKKVRQVFDPEERCNPGKIFPTPGRCIEIGAASYRRAAC